MDQIIEILIVEDDKNMCEAFEFAIQRNKKFHLAAQTGKQCEGLELLRTGKIGAVILDLELEEGDGLNFLNDMKELGIEKPVVIIITNNRSDTTHACLRANGADFICPKYNESYSPDEVLGIISLIYPFRRKTVSSQMRVITYEQEKVKVYQRNKIEEELAYLGFKRNGRGVGYLIDAIQYIAFGIKDLDCEMKEVYSEVAKKNNTKYTNVEKTIRDNIEKNWNKTRPEILERYYPYEVSKGSGAPTNMEFIKNMARKVRNI